MRLGRTLVLAALAGLAAGLWGCDDRVFTCEHDDDCDAAEGDGVCEANGYCSFVAPECGSGRAFGELAPMGVAGKCVPTAPVCIEACEDDDLPAPPEPIDPAEAARRHETTSDPETFDPTGDEPIAPFDGRHCGNGVRDRDETDVDCGGGCGGCDPCSRCAEDRDCSEGICDDGTCRTVEVIELDWLVDCGPLADLDVTIAVPPGDYVATALPSAGSKWSSDVGGFAWSWRIDCIGGELDALRAADGRWSATPEAAFAALSVTTATVGVGPEGLSCGVADTYCHDNRGSVVVELATACF